MDITPLEIQGYPGFVISGKMCQLNDFQSVKSSFSNLHSNIAYAILDLEKLVFISSHGVGILVEVNKMLEKGNTKFLVYRPSEEVSDVLTLTGIDQFLTICPLREDLLRELRSPAA